MNRTQKAALLLSSLSVYRSILDKPLPKAYLELLCAYNSPPLEFTKKWGEFFSLLCNSGFADNLMGYMTEVVLFDENAFTTAAAGHRWKTLPASVISAAQRDIDTVKDVASLPPTQLLADYTYATELGYAAKALPLWNIGTAAPPLDADECINDLADYHGKNGCGIFARHRAFVWRNGRIEPVLHPDEIRLSSLKEYKTQRETVVSNTKAFLSGIYCNNCLLYGDRGTGKSSTVKAILNEYYTDGLRMVEMPKERLFDFPILAGKLASLPLRFIVFIDDLSFSGEDKSYAQLKAILEGSLNSRPDNVLIYATSNRRHLIREAVSDREDDLHLSDSMQEILSLSDRFGLSVFFGRPDKREYLEIVRSLASEHGLNIPEDVLFNGAEQWAIERGGRSPRCARQYISVAEAGIKI